MALDNENNLRSALLGSVLPVPGSSVGLRDLPHVVWQYRYAGATILSGPSAADEAQVYVQGQQESQVYLSGAVEHQRYVSGQVEGQVQPT